MALTPYRLRGTDTANANETILIIEDEEYLALSIRDLLEPSGYEIHIAPDREEGREKLERMKPDLLLLNLALPPSYAVRDGGLPSETGQPGRSRPSWSSGRSTSSFSSGR